MDKKPIVIAGAAVLVALAIVAGVGLWMINDAKKSEEVTAETVLAAFQDEDDGTRDVAGAPAPGIYTYDAVGSEAGGAASVKIERDLPAQAKMIVWQKPGGYQARLLYSADHVEEWAYTITDEGRALNWTRTKLSVLGSTSDDASEVNPEALWIPADPKEGDTWESRFDSDGYTTSFSSTVTGTEKVSVGGQEFDTIVIERVSEYSGDLSGGWTDTFWWSPELNLPVKLAVTGESKQGLGVFSQDSELTLTSAEPQV